MRGESLKIGSARPRVHLRNRNHEARSGLQSWVEVQQQDGPNRRVAGGNQILTPQEYSRAVEALGTRRAVAEMLGVDIGTIFRRIAGKLPITKEAELAISSLRPMRKKSVPRRPNSD